MKTQKTNAMRLLDAAKIPYRVIAEGGADWLPGLLHSGGERAGSEKAGEGSGR